MSEDLLFWSSLSPYLCLHRRLAALVILFSGCQRVCDHMLNVSEDDAGISPNLQPYPGKSPGGYSIHYNNTNPNPNPYSGANPG